MDVTAYAHDTGATSAGSSDSGWLRGTLGGYEVRELHGHELAQYFHQIVTVEGSYDESHPISSDFD